MAEDSKNISAKTSTASASAKADGAKPDSYAQKKLGTVFDPRTKKAELDQQMKSLQVPEWIREKILKENSAKEIAIDELHSMIREAGWLGKLKDKGKKIVRKQVKKHIWHNLSSTTKKRYKLLKHQAMGIWNKRKWQAVEIGKKAWSGIKTTAATVKSTVLAWGESGIMKVKELFGLKPASQAASAAKHVPPSWAQKILAVGSKFAPYIKTALTTGAKLMPLWNPFVFVQLIENPLMRKIAMFGAKKMAPKLIPALLGGPVGLAITAVSIAWDLYSLYNWMKKKGYIDNPQKALDDAKGQVSKGIAKVTGDRKGSSKRAISSNQLNAPTNVRSKLNLKVHNDGVTVIGEQGKDEDISVYRGYEWQGATAFG